MPSISMIVKSLCSLTSVTSKAGLACDMFLALKSINKALLLTYPNCSALSFFDCSVFKKNFKNVSAVFAEKKLICLLIDTWVDKIQLLPSKYNIAIGNVCRYK